MSCPFVKRDPIRDCYEKWKHLDKRIERLPTDGPSQYVNDIIKDFWHAIKDGLEERINQLLSDGELFLQEEELHVR